MLAKSGATPRERLLSLFDILEDWVLAPHVEIDLNQVMPSAPVLVSFCTEQARLLGAESPEILAEHIVLIAHNAALQTLEHPGSNSLMHAKKAAGALIEAQTQKNSVVSNIRISRPAMLGIAASMMLAVGLSFMMSPALFSGDSSSHAHAQQATATVIKKTEPSGKALTAIDASRMYAKYEQMRQGSCQFPEALQIPDKHKSIYLENVVGGKLPADLDDLAIANYYLEKVRCNYTPTLMAISK